MKAAHNNSWNAEWGRELSASIPLEGTRKVCRAMRVIAGLTVVSLASGCGLITVTPVPPPGPPPTTQLTWRLPHLVPLAESNPTQTMAGVSLTATPIVYQKQVREVHADEASGTLTTGAPVYCRVHTPVAFVAPDRLAFTVSIVNGLERVFRSAGAVITLNVDGSTLSFDQSGIKEFLDVTVIPRGQVQVTIWGPPLSILRNSGTIGLFIFDVVTAVDAAGAPTQKHNFEWYFTYGLTPEFEVRPLRGETMLQGPRGGLEPAQVRGARCPS